MRKILLLGGTGAIGVYLVPELINLGFDVFVTSRSTTKSDIDKLAYIKGNARDITFLKKILTDSYDAIVDFMAYPTEEFRYRYELLLESTKHYIFLSSGRVFAESNLPLTETSPRLLDVSNDSKYLATDEYALAKARQENILRNSQYKNWTIIRPTITYSKTRFQLGTLEAQTLFFHVLCNRPVILPQEMLNKQTAMTWAGDVAAMIAPLILNKSAFCEDFNVCTAEHRLWEDIASYYNKLIGLNISIMDFEPYLKIMEKEGWGTKYQLLYSRMYNRIWDNSKILKITDMQQTSLMPIYEGLAKELSNSQNIMEMTKILFLSLNKNGLLEKIHKKSFSRSVLRRGLSYAKKKLLKS